MKLKIVFLLVCLSLFFLNMPAFASTGVQTLGESYELALVERATSIMEWVVVLLFVYSVIIGVVVIFIVIYAKKRVMKFKKDMGDAIQNIQVLAQGFNGENQKKINYIEERLKTFENDFSIFITERKKSYHTEIEKIKRDIQGFIESSSEAFLNEKPDITTSEKLFRLTTMLEFLVGIGDKLTVDEYLIMGKYYFFENNFEKAFENFGKASEIVEHSAEIWNLKGAVYYKIGKFDQELLCYEKSLKINPDNIKVMTNKAAVLMNLKHYDTAEMLLKKILGRDENYFWAWWLLGLVLSEKKRLKDAEKAFLRAAKLDPFKSEIHYRLASIYALADNWIDCVKYLKRAVKMNTKYKAEVTGDSNFNEVRNYDKFQELIGAE